MRKKSGAFCAISLFLLSIISYAETNHVLPTTICEVKRNPKKYVGKTISIRAYVISDLIHMTLLVDSKCDSAGIAFNLNPIQDDKNQQSKLIKDESYRKLKDDLYPQILLLQKQHRRIYGTFQGVFQYHSKNVPSRVLILCQVRDLYVGSDDTSENELKRP